MGRLIKLRSWNPRFQKPLVNIYPTNSLSDKIGATKGYLSSDCRRQFLEKCWKLHLSDAEWSKCEGKYDSYFSGYEEYCRLDRPRVLLQCSHDELCQSVLQLATGTREHVEKSLSKIIPAPTGIPRDDRSVVAFIGMAVIRIDLTNWAIDETLQNYIRRTLGVVSTQTDRDWLPFAFNAASFTLKAGIRVRWQRDLMSHLHIVFGEPTLNMFHDVALLDLLEKSLFKDLFPAGFIEETRRTVDLILPMSDPQCRHWLKQESHQAKIGINVERGAYDGIVDRNLHTFEFWRDRLIVAKDVFDRSQPKGLKMLIRDDRNKVQYWTFWIAFVVFWLTLGGFITGCMQTYKAYHPSPQPPWPGSASEAIPFGPMMAIESHTYARYYVNK